MSLAVNLRFLQCTARAQVPRLCDPDEVYFAALAESLNPCRRRREDAAMTDKELISSISGDTEVAGTPSIAAPGALYAADLSTPKAKKPEPELLPSRGRVTALRRRRLTKTEEEETIIINRPGRSTYPEQKSVLTSGATPH